MAKRCLVKIAEYKAEQYELYWMLYIFYKEWEYSGESIDEDNLPWEHKEYYGIIEITAEWGMWIA